MSPALAGRFSTTAPPGKPNIAMIYSGNVLPMLASRSFMVAHLIFTSLNYLEFIFAYCVKECSNFIGLHVADQLSLPGS